MNNYKSIAEDIIRGIILLIVAVGTSYKNANNNLEYFLLFFLIFIFNTRIRTSILKNKSDNRLLLLSIFLDFALIYIIFNRFPDYTYLLIYLTIFDNLLFLKDESYIILIIASCMMIFYTNSRSIEIRFLNIIIYSAVVVFSIMVRNLRNSIKSIELMYDDNSRNSYRLKDSKKILEEYSKNVEHVTQLEERNRLSQEIHDTIGHKLTGVIMQLDAAIRISELDSDKGREMIHSVRDNMNQCIEILRYTVKNMNQNQYFNRILSIKQMIMDFSKASGIDIKFDVVGIPIKLMPSAEVAIYKNVQEAITNAARHGSAGKISVILEYKDNQVILIINDNGKGCSEIIEGMGIMGMRERAEILGGTILVTSDKVIGFEVKTIIPLKFDNLA